MLIVAHIDPDPDTVGSALALASAIGTYAAIPEGGSPALKVLPLHEVSDLMLKSLTGDINTLVLADFHSSSQLMPPLMGKDIIAIYDHHRDGDLTAPVMHIEPRLGATATLVARKISKEKLADRVIATLLLAGIVHDTAGLRLHASEEDIEVANWLANVAGIDPEKLLMDMAQAEIEEWKPENDLRVYQIRDKTIAVGQIRVPGVAARKDIQKRAWEFVTSGGWDGTAYLISDPAADRTDVLAAGVLKPLTGTYRLMSRKVDFLPMVKRLLGDET